MRAALEPSSARAPSARPSATSGGGKPGAGGKPGGGGGGYDTRGEPGKGRGGGGGGGGSNSWLRISCGEGKNRQIRRVCAHLGLTVSRLIRVGFGPYTLSGCDRGALLKVRLFFRSPHRHTRPPARPPAKGVLRRARA